MLDSMRKSLYPYLNYSISVKGLFQWTDINHYRTTYHDMRDRVFLIRYQFQIKIMQFLNIWDMFLHIFLKTVMEKGLLH